MKIAFYSNFLNHHQLPLCMEFLKRSNTEFIFVATEEIPQARLDMKYEDMNKSYPFVLRAYESDDAKNTAMQLAEDVDILIIGSAPDYYINKRLKKHDKITFRFCERSLRKGSWRRFIPRTRNKIINDYIQYIHNRLYVLCASAYTAHDLAICGFPSDKCYRWGYFPKVDKILDLNRVLERKKKNSIIWVGRFISCKHPETALKIAKKLKKSGLDFSLKMIGDGPLKQKTENFVKENDLNGVVEFTGSLTADEVRECMLESEIFLFNSDFYEGWGAVVNEAMSSMCVPIISHACGSAAFLIKPKENGFIYRYKNEKEAVKYIKQLLVDCETKKKLSQEAYYTMINEWNASIAAERLLVLSDQLMGRNKCDIYMSGPCSKSPLYKNNWYKG